MHEKCIKIISIITGGKFQLTLHQSLFDFIACQVVKIHMCHSSDAWTRVEVERPCMRAITGAYCQDPYIPKGISSQHLLFIRKNSAKN